MLRGTFYEIGERKQLEAKLLAVNEPSRPGSGSCAKKRVHSSA